MLEFDAILSNFVILWAVIDPIGTIPVFLAVTKKYDENEKKRIAVVATGVAFAVLVFFFMVGDFILTRVGVPISAFQISGGVILFLFALNMIFGSSKPEEEILLVKKENETAIFPLAIPSIASPGAILAIVLLSEAPGATMISNAFVLILLVIVLIINHLLMVFSNTIHHKIGNSGEIIISKIMGLILASMAANNILLGIKLFFKIS